MRGCLSLPFRLLMLALLALGCFVAWSYRREIKRQIHQWTADSGAEAVSGVADPAIATLARRKITALGAGSADSVTLTPPEMASLAAALAEAVAPRAVDSVEVRLDNDDVEVRALVDTRQVPVSLGPLAGMVKDREYVEVGGRVVFRRTGWAEWQVDRVRVRGLPIPKELFGRVLQRFSPGAQHGVIGFPISRNVTGLRVTPTGVTLYGTGRSP